MNPSEPDYSLFNSVPEHLTPWQSGTAHGTTVQDLIVQTGADMNQLADYLGNVLLFFSGLPILVLIGYYGIKFIAYTPTPRALYMRTMARDEEKSPAHAPVTAGPEVPAPYAQHASHWRLGYADGKDVETVAPETVRCEIADYSRDEFNAYYDGFTARVTYEQQRSARATARTEEIVRVHQLYQATRDALRNEL